MGQQGGELGRELQRLAETPVHLLDTLRTFSEIIKVYFCPGPFESHIHCGDIVAVLPKKMLWEQGNTIEPCRHWLCDEMEKMIAACITCADFKALLSSRPESESDVAG